MTMQFSINKDFANRYNTYRQKEELQKLKERYGDVQLKKNMSGAEQTARTELDVDGTESSASSTTSSDENDGYSSSAEREHEDFLVLYEALCKNDPQLNDPSKQWFRDPESSSSSDAEDTPPGDNHSKDANEVETDNDEQTQNKKKKKERAKKANKHDVLTLRDYDRQFLLEHGGIEEESTAAEAKQVAKLESDVLLRELTKSDANASKQLFLKEADVALKRSNAKETDVLSATDEPTTAGFLTRRKSESSKDERMRHRKARVNVENLVFTDQPNSEAEVFLRDYIVNQRWRHPSARIPSYSEVLRSANVELDEAETGDKTEDLATAFADEEILDEDDNFLVRVHDFERNQMSTGAAKPPVKHRFEEEDKEFIKSYPRKIDNSIHQVAASKARSSRAEKRQARKQRKLEEKRAKMAELDRLRRLKLSLYAEKIERIKRSCGAGCDLSTEFDHNQVDEGDPDFPISTLNDKSVDQTNSVSGSGAKKPGVKTALELAMHLDEDWDPEKHDQLLNRMFDQDYYEIQEDPGQIPQFSDDDEDDDRNEDNESDDLSEEEVEEENNYARDEQAVSADDASSGKKKQRRNPMESASQPAFSDGVTKRDCLIQAEGVRRRRRLRGKARLKRALEREKDVYDPSVYPDYETYFQKYYHLNCEDVIAGPTPDEDVFCRFKYRKVTPNDFGLSTEEVLTATPGELNSWVPINRVTAYRTEDEEERDKRLFHSNHKLHKKTRILSSLSNPDAHWWPDEKTSKDDESKSGSRRKRSKRKRKRAHADPQQLDAANLQAPEPADHPVKKGDLRKVNGINISAARLQASGLSVKDLHRARKRKQKSDKKTKQSDASATAV